MSAQQRVLLQGWEQFDERADRIVSTGALSMSATSATSASLNGLPHTAAGRRDAAAEYRSGYFQGARPAGPANDGRPSLLHRRFILDEIFPAGWLPTVPTVEEPGGAGLLRADPDRVDAALLCEDPQHVGGSINAQQRSGNRTSLERRGITHAQLP